MSVLAKLLKNNRICVTVAVIIAIIANLSQMIYIVYIGELVNRIENREKVTSTLVTILACFLISNVVTVYLKHYSGRYAAEKMAHSLRMGFIGKLLERKSGYRSSEGESVDKKVRYLDKSVKTDAGAVMSKVQMSFLVRMSISQTLFLILRICCLHVCLYLFFLCFRMYCSL